MSAYALQKMIRDINRLPDRRAAYFAEKEIFAKEYALSDEERAAFLSLDIGRLYALGVHGLLLRPFTILHEVPEADYLDALRAKA
jgi:hypothetical protein